MAKPIRPEPKFFLIDELFDRGVEYYSRTWFENLPPDRLYGEKSTNYLESPWAAERIAATLPNVKLIFLLRDPIDRAYSNFRWSRANGMEAETDFALALELEESREANLPEKLRYARPHAYFSRGLYADLLAPYFAAFPRDRILVLRHEDIEAAPGDVAAQLHRFLGVTARPHDADELGIINAAPQTDVPSLSHSLRAALIERYREPNRRLSALLGPSFKLWLG